MAWELRVLSGSAQMGEGNLPVLLSTPRPHAGGRSVGRSTLSMPSPGTVTLSHFAAFPTSAGAEGEWPPPSSPRGCRDACLGWTWVSKKLLLCRNVTLDAIVLLLSSLLPFLCRTAVFTALAGGRPEKEQAASMCPQEPLPQETHTRG